MMNHPYLLHCRSPSSWSAGTLSLLGDLLYVFDAEDLDAVQASARVEAADVMARNTKLHLQIEWPGKLSTITYYEV